MVIWYLWFKSGKAASNTRVQLLATLISVFFVMGITFGIASLVPFRPRPYLNQDFNFVYLAPLNLTLSKMSSFPSDHAALFISLSTGFLFVSKKIGLMAMLYTIFLIFVPRLYLGYHYPTDLLAGSLIAASITSFFNYSTAIKRAISNGIIPFVNKYPGCFYCVLFLITYQITDLFWGSREILHFLHMLYMRDL